VYSLVGAGVVAYEKKEKCEENLNTVSGN